MTPADKTVHTIDDVYALELIDGQIRYKETPPPIHSRLISRIGYKLESYIDQHHGTCKVYPAPFAVLLNDSKTPYLEPDISVVCDPSKVDSKGCHGAPDWIIEIVSPSSVADDYLIKLQKYRSAGVREYWIVDPQKNRTTVWNLVDLAMEEYSFSEPVPAFVFDPFSIVIQDLDL